MHEILSLFDKNDNLIGQTERTKVHEQGLWHRRVSIFIFNSNQELLIQKRAPNMARPNLWCASASGHVLAGENPDDAASRELKEELGILCQLKFIGKISVCTKDKQGIDKIDKEHHYIYSYIWNNDFKVQKKELSDIYFFKVSDLQETLQFKPEQFTPGFIKEFEYYLKTQIYTYENPAGKMGQTRSSTDKKVRSSTFDS